MQPPFTLQGGQSRGLPDWIHKHYEPVIGHHRKEKWFKTFVILSQITCGKVQNPPYIFSAQDYVKVSPGFAAFSRLPRPTEEKNGKFSAIWYTPKQLKCSKTRFVNTVNVFQ